MSLFSAQPGFTPSLGFVVVNCQPLHVVRPIRTLALERDDMIDLVAGAGAMPGAGHRAGAQSLEFSLGGIATRELGFSR